MLKEKRNDLAGSLSGGQRQMVAVGRALMTRLLAKFEDGDRIIAQGSGDLAKLRELCMANPGRIFPYDVDLTSEQAIGAFVDDVKGNHPVPTHIVHLPALRAVNTKFKNYDEERFALDMNVQVNSAVQLCKALLLVFILNGGHGDHRSCSPFK